jgi:hypothetical protein
LILYIFLWISSMQDGKNLANRNYNFVSSCHTLVKFISKTPFFFFSQRKISSYYFLHNETKLYIFRISLYNELFTPVNS